MRILITGAYGFLGRSIVQALQKLAEAETGSLVQQGLPKRQIEIVGAGRDVSLGRRLSPGIDWIDCDFNRDLKPEAWQGHLENIDVIINAIGVLKSDRRNDPNKIHGEAAIALFEAAEQAGVKKIIQISAITVGEESTSKYSQSKLLADKWLEESDVNHVIVRPSVVVGGGAYGGTALMRGLAGLPFTLPVPAPGDQKLQPIWLEDFAGGVANLALSEKNRPEILYAVGPQTLTIEEMLTQFRQWLGFRPVSPSPVPGFFLKPILWSCDVLRYFGIKTALGSTILTLLNRETRHDHRPFEEACEIKLQSLTTALARHPASLQDRQHARTYFWWPLLQGFLALSWIIFGIISLEGALNSQFWTDSEGANLVKDGQMSVTIKAVIDILLGIMFLNPRAMRFAGTIKILMIAISLFGILMAVLFFEASQDLILLSITQLVQIFMIALLMAHNEKR